MEILDLAAQTELLKNNESARYLNIVIEQTVEDILKDTNAHRSLMTHDMMVRLRDGGKSA